MQPEQLDGAHDQRPPVRVHLHSSPRWPSTLHQAHQVRLPDHRPGLLREDAAVGVHHGRRHLQAGLHGGGVEHSVGGAQEGVAELCSRTLEESVKIPAQCPPQVLYLICKTYLTNAPLSEKVWTREQRLAAMEGITLSEVLKLLLLLLLLFLSEVVEFAKTFLDSHSLESLYYGNLSKEQARELTDLLVGERADYLERRAAEIGATVEVKTSF